MVANNTDSKLLTAQQLAGAPHTFVSYPASFSNYQEWSEQDVTTDNPGNVGNTVMHAKIRNVALAFQEGLKHPSLSTTLIYFPPAAQSQSYLIEAGLQCAERHTEASSMGSLMRAPLGGDAETIRRQQRLVERAAGHLVGEHPGLLG